MCVGMIKSRLNATPLVLQLPIGAEADFIGVVDLVAMKALVWPGETKKGEDYIVEEIPANMLEEAKEKYLELSVIFIVEQVKCRSNHAANS